MANWADIALSHHRADEPFPSLSASEPGCTVAQAYVHQQNYLRLRNEPVAGYKAALTAPPAQQFMGVDQPITGVLLQSGDHPSGASLQAQAKLKLETELGFVVAQAITGEVSAATVYDHIDGVLPMFEVAAPYLAQPPNGIDLIATNSAAHAFVRGTQQPLGQFDLDTLDVTLHRDDTELHQAGVGTVMAGQAHALAWLINHQLALGLPIVTGQLLMTGSIGALHDAEEGHYRADFGALGTVELTILPPLPTP